MQTTFIKTTFSLAAAILVWSAPARPALFAQPNESSQSQSSPQQRGRGGRGAFDRGGAYKSQITPHWFHHDACFWYRHDLKNSAKEFIVGAAERGKRAPAFCH